MHVYSDHCIDDYHQAYLIQNMHHYDTFKYSFIVTYTMNDRRPELLTYSKPASTPDIMGNSQSRSPSADSSGTPKSCQQQ